MYEKKKNHFLCKKSKFLPKLDINGKKIQIVSGSVLRVAFAYSFYVLLFLCFQYLINSASAGRCFLNCFIVHCFSAHFCRWHFFQLFNLLVQPVHQIQHIKNAGTIKKFIVFYNCALNVLNLFSS